MNFQEAFAAINLDWPLLMILGGFGFIVGTGGSAVLLFPLRLGVDGIRLSFVASELIAGVVTALFAVLKRSRYHYW